jgi:hypothetical protein
VQYFVNEGKQGKAKNVLVVTYSKERNLFRAKNDKSVQYREYFDLTCGREINRKTKKYYGAEISEEIKQDIKALKTEKNITTMFGIRQVRYKFPHKTHAGKWFHKRQLDVANMVFAHIIDDSLIANFFWEGKKISVVISPHSCALKEGQSVGIGYYTSASSDAELAERLLELKSISAATLISEDDLLKTEETTPIDRDNVTSENAAYDAAAPVFAVGVAEQAFDSEQIPVPVRHALQTIRKKNAHDNHRKDTGQKRSTNYLRKCAGKPASLTRTHLQ